MEHAVLQRITSTIDCRDVRERHGLLNTGFRKREIDCVNRDQPAGASLVISKGDSNFVAGRQASRSLKGSNCRLGCQRQLIE
jgi:hypothetical protein